MGRDPACELVLDDPTVSRRHARLGWDEEGPYVEDAGSRHGIWVEGRPLPRGARARLVEGGRVRLGGFELQLVEAGADAAASEAVRLLKEVLRTTGEGGLAEAALVLPGGPRVELEGDEVIVGRGAGCDVRLAGLDVSRVHCRLLRGPLGFEIEDLGSRNGVRVDGEPVAGRWPLRDGAKLSLGGLALRFEDPVDLGARRRPPPSARAGSGARGQTLATDRPAAPTHVARRPPPRSPAMDRLLLALALSGLAVSLTALLGGC